MADAAVPIEILGQRYPIRSGLDATYVQELGRYVDEKMRAVSDLTPGGESFRTAVVAALNIADEVFRLRAPYDSHEAELLQRVANIERLIDDMLAGCPALAPARQPPGPGPSLDPRSPPF